MRNENINIKKIEKVINESVLNIKKITYGYTNDIYSINEKYILKICTNERNFDNFRRASKFCKKYFGRISCPKILYSNLNSDTGSMWQIEEKVMGENLFFRWGKLDDIERAEIIYKICKELKKINTIPVLDVFEKNFESIDWKNKFKKDILKKITSLEEKGLKYDVLYNKIITYMYNNLSALNETDYRICHTDMHFDNIMIDDNNDITILDYDRLRISSLDYELSIFNIMSKTPELIANEDVKNKINKKDYMNILEKVQQNYKETSNFSQLDKRLNIYAIKHYLGLLNVIKEKDKVISSLEELVTVKNVTKHIASKDEEER